METCLAALPKTPSDLARWVAERDQAQDQIRPLREQVAALERQLDWFKRQLFGQISERRRVDPPPEQLNPGEGLERDVPASAPAQQIPAHSRRPAERRSAEGDEASSLFFDPAKVPVEVIPVPNPEIEGLTGDPYAVIGEKVSDRLAQRPGSHVILKYVRPVIKRRDTQALSCPPAPLGVLEHSRADVSFIVGMVLDKFLYHQPLYRQHQRLKDNGIQVSRAWLTGLVLMAV